MRLENLKIGKGIEVYVTREGYRYRLGSNIEETDKDKVYITLIASGNRTFRFLDTDLVEIIYRDGVYIWQWEKVKGTVELLEGVKVHVLHSKEKGKTFNRRNAFRVDFGEEIVIYQFRENPSFYENKESSDEKVLTDEYGNEMGAVTIEEFEGNIRDLSEGGVGICTNKKLEIGDVIGFPLYTPFGCMYLKGNVVRHMEKRSEKYLEFYGCNFIRSDKNLTKYLFSLQRERLSKQRQGE